VTNETNLPGSKHERQSSDWDVRNAPKNYISLILTQVGGSFFAFASVWVITRALGSEGYGGVVAIIAASQVAQMLTNWTMVAVLRFGVDEFVETGRIPRIFWLRFLTLIPQIGLVLIFSFLWFPPLANWLKLSPSVFWFVVWHFISACIWTHVQFSLQGVKLQKLQGGLQMLERFLIFVGIVALVGLGRVSEISIIVAYTVSPMILTAIGVWFLRSFIFAGFSVDRQVVRQIFMYSLPLLPFTLLSYFSTGYIDAIFLTKFLSKADLGIYSVSSQINGIMLQLPTLANSLLIPLFVTLEKEANSKRTEGYFRDIIPGLTLFWGVGAAVVSFIGYFAIPLIFGSEFSPAGKTLWILFVSSTASFPILIGYSALVHSTSNTGVAFISALIAAVLNIGGNFLLIPVFGIEGCAWATVIAFLGSTAVWALLLRKRVQMKISWTFIAMIPGIGGALCLSLLANPYWALLVCLVMGLLVTYLQKDSLFRTIRFLKNLA
jgi:O-antigen/teichoic acid export membrane protein